MCHQSDQNVWVPTLADSACNLMEPGCENMLRYSVTSGEIQRTLAEMISKIQHTEADGTYFGVGETGEQ